MFERRSFLLQQGGDVDVPADGLPVEAAGEQVAGLVLFIPRRATHHSPVTLLSHTHTRVHVLLLRIDPTRTFPAALFPSSPFCCCVGVWPASLRSCRTVGPAGCRVAER